MTVIEFAEKRLNESCLNDDDEAVLYWRAYWMVQERRSENAEENEVAANE